MFLSFSFFSGRTAWDVCISSRRTASHEKVLGVVFDSSPTARIMAVVTCSDRDFDLDQRNLAARNVAAAKSGAMPDTLRKTFWWTELFGIE
jgi:hypothetical protein